PVVQNVDDGVLAYHRGDHRGCLMIGGGSALDVGKCIALMVGNPGSVLDYEDVGDNWTKADRSKIAPMIAMPTTAGTGSEVGRASVITDISDHSKKIIFHPGMLPQLVLADPEMTFGLPSHLTAATGIDAFVHAFEAFCAPGYHPMADGIAVEAMRLCKQYLPRCVADGNDAEARTHMLMAASMGATAFQKGLGLVHAMAHPLGATTDIHHGLANAILLPYAMEHNRTVIEDKMIHLARSLELRAHNFESVLSWVLDLRASLAIPHTLEEAQAGGWMRNQLATEQLAQIAEQATQDASLATNPKPCSAEEIVGVLYAAWSGV
ncbi:MAG: iron-containing alcohol dehydrogenase, partial [Nannocystaceae bacterium]